MSAPASPTASVWVSRLQRRLSHLADTASKESIQALSKWIGFRRTHVREFSAVLADAIADPTTMDAITPTTANRAARQWLYLQILHESIVLDSGTSRWDRFAEMREILGEFCALEVAQRGRWDDAATARKMEALVKHWDGLNAFGGPTLISMMKKPLTAVVAPPPIPEEVVSTVPIPPTSPPRSPKRERSTSPNPIKESPVAIPPDEKTDEMELPTTTAASPDPMIKSEEPPASISSTPTPVKKIVEYDFESMNIPFGKVDAKEFLAPCKAIATLQIARDLRSDTAIQASSLLNGLSEEIKTLCEEADKEVKETGLAYELPEKRARELSTKTSERLLDMDIEEQLQNVRTFTEVVEKQREARQRLIYLLIRSRCKFGADEAAKAFYDLEKIQVELNKRKDTLLDAMALEGVDFEEVEGKEDSKTEPEELLLPFSWYPLPQEEAEEEPDAKRIKVDLA